MIMRRIQRIAPPNTKIPKPLAKGAFKVKGNGRRRGEEALIYTIPNHNNPNKPYKKGITVSEFERAYKQLTKTGQLSRHWFRQHLSQCDAEGPCNFTTVGGLFELLGEAVYESRGVYRRKSKIRKLNA